MKKGLIALVASAVVCSMAFASPSANEPSFTGLNATEHAALFGESSTAQVAMLDNVEMKSTQGEVVLRVVRLIGSTLVTYANAPGTSNQKVYTKPLTNSNQYADYTYHYSTQTYTPNNVGGMFTHYTIR